MRPWYAINARKLLANRDKGLAPADPVTVSMTEHYGSLAVTDDMPLDRLDWRMLVNLDVHLIAGPAAALKRVLAVAAGIANARPKSLYLRFQHDGWHDVEIGTGLHLPAVLDIPATHRFTWLPINCSGTAVGAKLRQALRSQHADWTEL